MLVAGGLVALVYGLSEADIKGWGAPVTIVLLAAGAVLLAAVVLVEQRVAHPGRGPHPQRHVAGGYGTTVTGTAG